MLRTISIVALAATALAACGGTKTDGKVQTDGKAKTQIQAKADGLATRVRSQLQVEKFKQPAPATVAPPPSGLPVLVWPATATVMYFEGWSATAYDDPYYCTAGYGHLIALAPCASIALGPFSTPMTLEQGQSLLAYDLVTAQTAVNDEVKVKLAPDQFGALVSFTYNVGSGNLQSSTLLKLVNEGNFPAAAGQFPLWVTDHGQVVPGLVTRRKCEQSLFEGQLNLPQGQSLNPALCTVVTPPAAAPPIDFQAGEAAKPAS